MTAVVACERVSACRLSGCVSFLYLQAERDSMTFAYLLSGI